MNASNAAVLSVGAGIADAYPEHIEEKLGLDEGPQLSHTSR